MNQLFQKKWFPHVAAIVIAVITIYIYFNPMLSGKVLKQHDVQQWRATYNEIDQFQKNSGERTFWTNAIFSGMPTYLIGPSYKGNFTTTVSQFISTILPNPVDTMLLMFVCFYIMLLSFGISPWLAMAGGFAFMLSSFNLINIDAGHVGKGNAIAYMPLVIAGINYTLRSNKLIGALITGIALSLQLTAGHVQISYYLMLLILVWMLAEAITAIKEKKLTHLIICGIYLGVAAAIGAATNANNLLPTEEYGKYSIRGQSELTKSAPGQTGEETAEAPASTGLDKDYALQWSNGVAEPFTLLIPNFYGGSSSGELSTSSQTYKTLKDNGIPNAKQVIQGLPIYWGDQPFTAGPIYYGAIVCFLFILGLFVIKGREKWWILGISVLAILLSMGRNFMPLTDLFFYNFPLYNKFRSVTFILCITQVTFPLLALLALRDLISGKMKPADFKKPLLYSFYITGGLCLILALVPGMFFSFSSPLDERLPEWLRGSLISDRENLLKMDALRSLVFIAASFGLIWFFIAGKIKQHIFLTSLTLLIVIDLWGVDKRYVNDSDFETKKKNPDAAFPKTQADELILQDKDIHYRVYNTTQRLDQDAITSYWHKSIGGYHGAKMRRYQELVDYHLSKGNPEVYNMLNVKYFIVGDSSNNMYPQRNPDANGNAWFVNNMITVENADAEIDSMSRFNSKTTAIIDKRYADQIKDLKPSADSTASIRLISYAPNKLVYEANASSDNLAVFSEIYYDKGWNATIDGKTAEYLRCNYVLRGMKIPSGKHQIEFKFEPEVVSKGEGISLIASFLLYGGVVIAGGLEFMRRKKSADPKA